MKITETAEGIAATDAAGTRLPIRTDGWAEASNPPSVRDALAGRIDGPEEPDAVVTGRTRELEFPAGMLSVVSLDTGRRYYQYKIDDAVDLGDGRYLLTSEAEIRCFVCFDGSARLHQSSRNATHVTFPTSTDVTLGFESSAANPEEFVTVPSSPAGLATAISTLAATPSVTTAQRSWPSLRPHPPQIRFGDEQFVSDTLDTPGRSAVEIVVETSVGQVLSVAPLAYYLGATVAVCEDATPVVRTKSTEIPLSTGGEFDVRTNELLRRTFWLDCLVRSFDGYGEPVREASVVDHLDLQPERVAEAPPGVRLERYRSVQYDDVRDVVPPWTVRLTIEPNMEYVPPLARTLHRLPFIRRPGSPRLVDDEGPTAGTEVERRTHAPVEGRFGDGPPDDGFHALPSGFQHRDRYETGNAEELTITAVVNDGTLDGEAARQERTGAARLYRKRRDVLGHDVTIRRNLSVNELRRTIERGCDLLHFVGHHDDRGLTCTDGALGVDDIHRSAVRTFLLNACGSYPIGRRLVKAGSVAGAVTAEPVMNETAVAAGVAFAGFVSDGFTIGGAVEFLSRPFLSSDYTAVGDGTYVVTQSSGSPERLILTDEGNGYRLIDLRTSVVHVGGQTLGFLYDDPILGGPNVHELDSGRLDEFLSHITVPILFDGEFVSPDRLRDRF